MPIPARSILTTDIDASLKKKRKRETVNSDSKLKRSKPLASSDSETENFHKQSGRASNIPLNPQNNRDGLRDRQNAPEVMGRQGSARSARESQSSQITDLGDVASKLLNLKTYSRRESSPLQSNKRKQKINKDDESSDGEWDVESDHGVTPHGARMKKRPSAISQSADNVAQKPRPVSKVNEGSKSWFEAELNIGVDDESPWASRRTTRNKGSVEISAISSTHTPFAVAKSPSVNNSEDAVVLQSQSSPSW